MSAMDERYEGHFLDALDLPEGKLVSVEIESITDPMAERDASGKPIKSAILRFKGKSKGLVLNATNYKNLKAQFGKATEGWIGKTIQIQRRYLDAAHGFGVQNTLCIRIIPPVGTPILKSAAAFMGQASPYGQSAQKKQPQPARTPAKAEAVPPDDLARWTSPINSITSRAACQEFRDGVLPGAPEHLRPEVEAVLDQHEANLPESRE